MMGRRTALLRRYRPEPGFREEGIAFKSKEPAEVASEPLPVLPKSTRAPEVRHCRAADKPTTEPKAAKPRKAGTMRGNAKSAIQSKNRSLRPRKPKGRGRKARSAKGKASQSWLEG